jgi:hypothetical protein
MVTFLLLAVIRSYMKDFTLAGIFVTLTLILLLAVLLSGCSSKYEQKYQFSYTFDKDQESWTAGFADLPADYEPDSYALDSGWGELPSGLAGNAIYISGNNHSDDLFMYFQKHITGLRPNTTYQVQFEIELASNTPAGMTGIGGSPGENVYVKAGAVGYEPEIITDDIGWLRLDIDKGNQGSEGEDMINLGTLSNPNLDPDTTTGDDYALMTLNSQGRNFQVTSDKDGTIWVIIGSDSGFEGTTTVFYNMVEITLMEEE